MNSDRCINENIVGILVFALVCATIVCVILCVGKSRSQEVGQADSIPIVLPALRSNEQMLEFIFKSAKECFDTTDVSLTEYGYGHSRTSLKLITPYKDQLIIVYPCADSTENNAICQELYNDAVTEFRASPVFQYHCGNMIIVLYSGEERWQAERLEHFLESVVIDTREGMALAQRWQEWLAEKGIEMKIAESGFGLINHSISGLVSGAYQTLPLLVDGRKVELVCFADATYAQQMSDALARAWSVMDIKEGHEYYEGDCYGRFKVMFTRDNKEIEPFIKEFWGKQQY